MKLCKSSNEKASDNHKKEDVLLSFLVKREAVVRVEA
jgi:hypothetical protein